MGHACQGGEFRVAHQSVPASKSPPGTPHHGEYGVTLGGCDELLLCREGLFCPVPTHNLQRAKQMAGGAEARFLRIWQYEGLRPACDLPPSDAK